MEGQENRANRWERNETENKRKTWKNRTSATNKGFQESKRLYTSASVQLDWACRNFAGLMLASSNRMSGSLLNIEILHTCDANMYYTKFYSKENNVIIFVIFGSLYFIMQSLPAINFVTKSFLISNGISISYVTVQVRLLIALLAWLNFLRIFENFKIDFWNFLGIYWIFW